jgi:hypothetical protein
MPTAQTDETDEYRLTYCTHLKIPSKSPGETVSDEEFVHLLPENMKRTKAAIREVKKL